MSLWSYFFFKFNAQFLEQGYETLIFSRQGEEFLLRFGKQMG